MSTSNTTVSVVCPGQVREGRHIRQHLLEVHQGKAMRRVESTFGEYEITVLTIQMLPILYCSQENLPKSGYENLRYNFIAHCLPLFYLLTHFTVQTYV